LHLQNSESQRGAKCHKLHVIVFLMKAFAVYSLRFKLYCCCCFSVERDSALLVPQTISARDEPCVAVHFVAEDAYGKSVADVQSAQFSNDEIFRQCLILSENFSIPS